MNREEGARALAAAAGREQEIVRFLRDMIAIPAESGREEARCRRVSSEYERLGFDEVRFDALGSVVGRIGDGPRVLLMDGHVDCVGVGDPAEWRHDPFDPRLENGRVRGRGAVDELPAIAAMAHGAALAREAGGLDGVTLYLVASVLEEACDGLPLLHLIQEEGLRPDAVVLGEPTDLAVYRGHRGRMGVEIVCKGVSAHGAHCERGVNPTYALAPILTDVAELNGRLAEDAFLGKGSVTVSWIDCQSPSLNAVPGEARAVLDRRLTAGETPESALAELAALPHVGDARVRVLGWEGTAWTGREVRQEQIFPTWVLPEAHPLVAAVAGAAAAVLPSPPPSAAGPSQPTASPPWGASVFPRWASRRAARSSPTPPTSGWRWPIW